MNLTYSRLTSLSLLWCLFLNLVHRQKLALLLSYKSNHLSAMDVVQYNCCAYNDNNCKKVFPKRAGIQNIIIIQQHNYTKKIVCLRISIPKVCRNPNNIQLRSKTFFNKIAFLIWMLLKHIRPNVQKFHKKWISGKFDDFRNCVIFFHHKSFKSKTIRIAYILYLSYPIKR